MATNTGRTIAATYKNMLNVDNSNSGIDSTLRTVQDGEGTTSALQLSKTAVNIIGDFQVGGVTLANVSALNNLVSTTFQKLTAGAGIQLTEAGVSVSTTETSATILVSVNQNFATVSVSTGLYVGAKTVGTTMLMSGAVSVGGALDVTGAVSVGGALDVTGAVSVGDALGVTGKVSGTTMLMTGAVSVGGALDVTGAVSVGGDLDVTGGVSAADLTITGDAFADKFRGPSGAENQPTFSFSADTNTGMYLGANDALYFTTGGSKKIVVGDTASNIVDIFVGVSVAGASYVSVLSATQIDATELLMAGVSAASVNELTALSATMATSIGTANTRITSVSDFAVALSATMATSIANHLPLAGGTITGTVSAEDVVVSSLQLKANSFGTRASLTDAASISVALNTSDHFIVQLGGNRTLEAPTGLQPTQTGSIIFVQDGTGGRTLAFNGAWQFPSQTAPTLSTGVSAYDRVDFEVYTSAIIHAVATLDIG